MVVAKRTAWELYQADPEAYGNISKESRDRMITSSASHGATMKSLMAILTRHKVKPWIVDGIDPVFNSDDDDLIITVGGDGTLLSASHQVGRALVLGINSDPAFSKGHFCCTWLKEPTFEKLIAAAVNGDVLPVGWRNVTRMKVSVDDEVVADRILNEALFSHSNPAAMTRFVLEDGRRIACSGAWIGTGAGSTGALRSAGGTVCSMTDKRLQAVIREPWNPGPEDPRVLMAPSFTLISKVTDSTLYFDGPFMRVPVGFDQRIRFEASSTPLSLIIR